MGTWLISPSCVGVPKPPIGRWPYESHSLYRPEGFARGIDYLNGCAQRPWWSQHRGRPSIFKTPTMKAVTLQAVSPFQLLFLSVIGPPVACLLTWEFQSRQMKSSTRHGHCLVARHVNNMPTEQMCLHQPGQSQRITALTTCQISSSSRLVRLMLMGLCVLTSLRTTPRSQQRGFICQPGQR